MQKNEIKKIKIDDVEYVRADSVQQYDKAEDLDGMEYVIVRGDRSGVFAGYMEESDEEMPDTTVILRNARRLWYWDGAASISQLAMDGVSKPENCKFPKEVSRIKVLDAVEIDECTEKARKSITAVNIWNA